MKPWMAKNYITITWWTCVRTSLLVRLTSTLTCFENLMELWKTIYPKVQATRYILNEQGVKLFASRFNDALRAQHNLSSTVREKTAHTGARIPPEHTWGRGAYLGGGEHTWGAGSIPGGRGGSRGGAVFVVTPEEGAIGATTREAALWHPLSHWNDMMYRCYTSFPTLRYLAELPVKLYTINVDPVTSYSFSTNLIYFVGEPPPPPHFKVT